MTLDKEDFIRLFKIFTVECEEHIQGLSKGFISLEKNPDQPALLENIFREAHSLKGAARMINLTRLESVAHCIETILVNIKKGDLFVTHEVTNAVLKGLDIISAVVKRITEGGTEQEVDVESVLNLLADIEEGVCDIDSRDLNRAETGLERDAGDEENTEQKQIGGEMNISLFLTETADAYRKLVNGLLTMEQDPMNRYGLLDAYENIHALKGSARIINHDEMADLAYSIETVLSLMKEDKLAITPLIMNTMLDGTDIIKVFVSQIESDQDKKVPAEYYNVVSALNSYRHTNRPVISCIPFENPEPEQAVARTTPLTNTVRVSADKLDRLMEQSSELLTMKSKSKQTLHVIETLISYCNLSLASINKKKRILRLNRIKSQERNYHSNGSDSNLLFTKSLDSLSKITGDLEDLFQNLSNDFRYFTHITDNIQYEVRKTRLLPLNTIMDVFPRMVRDIAASLKKKVRFEMRGTDLELDKYILEEIKAPLMHILRNSIDHGIESTQQRIDTGKPEEGLITVQATHRGSNAIIEINDDGVGINIDLLRKAAVTKEIYSEEKASNLDDKQLLKLIFHSGFSTSETITDLSGRGIGLDVVKANLERVNGTIDIETSTQIGTTIVFSIPLTLRTIKALKIGVGDEIFFVPVNMVETIMTVSEQGIPSVEGIPSIHFNDTLIPYVTLASLLDVPSKTTEEKKSVPAAVLKSGKTLIAFGVDRFLGEEEVLIKGLGSFLKRVRNILGITIMSDGAIAPILNVADMISTIQSSNVSTPRKPISMPEPDEASILNILIVDDSPMTRAMEQNILESYGYDVTTAEDGKDALIKIKQKKFDVVVSDVQMPEMDGITLTKNIKADEELKNIPVILLTALETTEDKRRGIEVGADAYIMKSSFESTNLLNTIKRLV